MGPAIILIVMLSLVSVPFPCSAEPPSSGAVPMSSGSLPSAEEFGALAPSTDTLGVAPDLHGPFSANAVERQRVLWQAPKLAELTTPQPTGPTSATSPEPPEEEEAVAETIPDPIEPVNRVFFTFNDKLYFWLLKPVATGYKAVLSTDLRVCIRNFFHNLKAPVYVGNCLLQGKVKCAGNETGRFFLNSTFGFFGFFDQAKDKFEIQPEDRDFGQTLGVWGLGPSFYIDWPLLGPSSLRDTGGFVGDLLMDPRTYFLQWPVSTASRATETVNNTSLTIGEYESLKKAAIDPYIAVRDGYHQYRQNKIKNK